MPDCTIDYLPSYRKPLPRAYDKLLDKDPKFIQMDLCDIITYIKKVGTLRPLSTYTPALNKFFSMNVVTTLNWKKINSFLAEHETTAKVRPNTHSEIQHC
jgi:hypothetical protein